MYAIYNKKIYKLNILENNFEIYSESKDIVDSTFNEIKIEQGFFTKIIYTKKVDISDIELAYELTYKVLYKGEEYECLNVNSHSMEIGSITIYTKDSEKARRNGFVQADKFIFDKEIPLDEIDALIEIKSPILKFSNLKEQRIKIVQKDIRDYLSSIL